MGLIALQERQPLFLGRTVAPFTTQTAEKIQIIAPQPLLLDGFPWSAIHCDYQQIPVSYRKYISHESVCIGRLCYGIDNAVYEIMSCEKSQKQSPWEHPATAAAQSENDATREDVYPPLWDRAPESLLDFLVKDNKIVINPWNYQERLGMYKNMLNSSAKYFTAFGSQNFGNILWGLPLQHGWQFRTGRLADPSSVTSCGYEDGDLLCISVRSWWSCMNYYLAVIPFLGAVEAGLFGQLQYEIEILPPEEQRADFCYSVADCRSRNPKLMDEWKAYFEYLLSTEHKAGSPATFSSFKMDDALCLMWRAHVSSIAYALPKFQDSLKYLSDPEANFGEDWANAVDFIAATHFSTDLQTTNEFQSFLPQRMLTEGDVLPSISDFSPQQNRVLLSLRALHKVNQLTGGLLLKLWQKAMSTEAGRKLGRKLIEDLASSQKFDPVGIYNDMKGVDLTAFSFLEKKQFQH